MSSYAIEENTENKGGLLSRMFNAIAPKGLIEWIAEIKEAVEDSKHTAAFLQSNNERHRQRQIDYAIYELLTANTNEEPKEVVKNFIDRGKKYNLFDFGKFDENEVLEKFSTMDDQAKTDLIARVESHFSTAQPEP